ncbi:uncharacterized protein METZ01_LOCUS257521, partial [marine metagenome]
MNTVGLLDILEYMHICRRRSIEQLQSRAATAGTADATSSVHESRAPASRR